ncbi:type II toxin-antitoxin system Phd/YefM family antitoxin [Streptomyces mayonensis]|uniref:type II toxin-antitoxin system Phd/YefM family antitoxin n=1 Tax=Streptomyces mayonensis TaxID=2750816 RepID=UPI001C1DE0EC|nr:type II toxin-antitoxin system Phd/YefM family antitoxin [Streptomyces sp. A108]MBU6535688.1 type II toxin-antitoxin system Phd/YefM family antitoxin [Streptomyces sp. A108]
MTEIAISAARSQLGDLVRRAAHGRETVALTDHGHVAALLVSPRVVEDLEDALVVADYQRRKAEGTLGEGIPMAEVRRRLGLEQK